MYGQGGQSLLRVPLHNLDGIVALGYNIGCSAHLMASCAEAGITLSFCTPNGRFLAAVQGFTPGNVLLRRSQYRLSDDPAASLRIAAVIVAAKLANARTVLLRAMRDHGASAEIDSCAAILARNAQMAMRASDMNALRGLEGDAGAAYFAVFSSLLKGEAFSFPGRVHRPPTDPVNALVSFLTACLRMTVALPLIRWAWMPRWDFSIETDLGRPSLALDLMEEVPPRAGGPLRSHASQSPPISPKDFRVQESSAVELTEEARKLVLTTWQERKRDEITHPFLEEKTTVGLLPFLQARLLPVTCATIWTPILLFSGDNRTMQLLITYDVATSTDGGERRLRRVAKVCLDYGQRVQNSVFECEINPAQLVELKARLFEIVDLDHDSLRFYNLGADWNRRVEHFGAKPSFDPRGR